MFSFALETSRCDLSIIDCIFPSPLNSYVEDLIPNVMVFRDGAFRRLLGHEGGILIIWIIDLLEIPENSLLPN